MTADLHSLFDWFPTPTLPGIPKQQVDGHSTTNSQVTALQPNPRGLLIASLAGMALAGRSCSDENRCVLVGLTSCHYGAWSPLLA